MRKRPLENDHFAGAITRVPRNPLVSSTVYAAMMKNAPVVRIKQMKGKRNNAKPKRPLTPYNVFFKEQRRLILLQSGGQSGGFAELARKIATRWKAITPEEYEACKKKAAEDKQRYSMEMKEFSLETRQGHQMDGKSTFDKGRFEADGLGDVARGFVGLPENSWSPTQKIEAPLLYTERADASTLSTDDDYAFEPDQLTTSGCPFIDDEHFDRLFKLCNGAQPELDSMTREELLRMLN